MEEVEITPEEVRGIDINQVASLQLKDGTVVVVKGEGELEGEVENYQEGEVAQEEILQEEIPQEEVGQKEVEQEELAPEEVAQEIDANQFSEGNYQEQSNQLRARPMMVRPVVPVVPVGGRLPRYHYPKPVLPPPNRGPVRTMAPIGYRYGMPLRARPGMRKGAIPPKYNSYEQPLRKVAPVPRKSKPLNKTRYPGIVGNPYIPPKTIKLVAGPVLPKPKPLVKQMVKTPVFRSRPANVEEEQDFQEEYAEEYQCPEYDEQAKEESGENQLRARPLVVPVRTGAPLVNPRLPRPVPHHYVQPKPRVPVVPVVPLGPKRGPVVAPVGYNTYQPRVFRARPGFRPVPQPVVSPMFTPVTKFQPIRPVIKPLPHHHLPGPRRPVQGRLLPVTGVFRKRPKSTNCDKQENAEECLDECNQTYVCPKCGKDF